MDKTIRKSSIVVFFWWATALCAQQAQELFLRANKAYEHGEYTEALRCYNAIKKKGPVLWYNIGNCYYHQQDFARAIVCWQRALLGASSALYADVEHNCAVAYRKLAKEYQRSRWDRGSAFLIYRMPMLMVQFLFLICWLFLCLILWRWKKSWRVYALMLCLLLMVLYLGCVVWYYYERQTHVYGIVLEKAAPVYVGPHTQYHVVGAADIGDKVQLVEQRSSWYKISKDGVTGWIPSSTIEIIEQLC